METNSLPGNKQDTPNTQKTPQEPIKSPEPQLPEALLNSELPLPLIKKVGARDIYDLGEYDLAVYTDRANVFDSPLACGIPERGKYMARLASYWLTKTKPIIPNYFKAHLQNADEIKEYLNEEASFQLPKNLVERCLVYKKSEPLNIEFEMWGFLTGTAWKEYQEAGTVFGHPQISGLMESQSIPGNVFVAFETDAEDNRKQLSEEEVIELLGPKLTEEIKDSSLRVYNDFQRLLRITGKFIIANMKFTFGKDRNKAYIANDILTPESACYWDLQHYRVGYPYYSYELQTLKAWLMHTSWKKRGPMPNIPIEIILQTVERHRVLCERITSKS